MRWAGRKPPIPTKISSFLTQKKCGFKAFHPISYAISILSFFSFPLSNVHPFSFIFHFFPFLRLLLNWRQLAFLASNLNHAALLFVHPSIQYIALIETPVLKITIRNVTIGTKKISRFYEIICKMDHFLQKPYILL